MILQLLQRGLTLYWLGNGQFVSAHSEVKSPRLGQFSPYAAFHTTGLLSYHAMAATCVIIVQTTIL